MVSLHSAYLWILIFVVVDSHSPLTDKKAEDGISVKSSCESNKVVINNLQNQINQETVIRLSLLKQVYSLVNDMINVKKEMAAMKTNAEEISKSTDDLRHEDYKMLNEIEQMKHDHNDTSESILNVQHEHNKTLNEIEQIMKFNQNNASQRIINVQHEYKTMFSEIEKKLKFFHNDTSERIENAQLEYKKALSETEQNHNDTSERIVNVWNYLLNLNNSVGNLRNDTVKINAKYGIQEKIVKDSVSEHGKIQDRLGILHNDSERRQSETQRMLANYNNATLKMKGDLQNITSRVNILDLLSKRHAQYCLESSHCWLLYSFDYDNSWNGCAGGRQYVTKTNYSSTPYLGVMTCSSTRYKLFLSKILTGKYYNIADGGGTGEDHCELLGTTQRGKLPGDFEKSANTQGFYRSSRGENFSFGAIGYRPSQTSMWYEKWIECSVNIPGNNRVIPM